MLQRRRCRPQRDEFHSSAMNGCGEVVVIGASCFPHLSSVQRFGSVLCTVELSANSIQLGDDLRTARLQVNIEEETLL